MEDFSSSAGEDALRDFQTYFAQYKHDTPDHELERYNFAFVEAILKAHANTILIVTHIKSLEVLYITKNIERVLGYSQAYCEKNPLQLFFRILELDNIGTVLSLSKWVNSVRKKVPKEWLHTEEITCCGIKARHKNGALIHFLLRGYPLVTEQASNIKSITLDTLTDIRHLITEKAYWFRIAYGQDSPTVFTRFPALDLAQEQDILTSREKEILGLIETGHDTNAIASQLGISHHTVSTHRKNMIERTGVRDTTALIELARLCGIPLG